MQSFPLYKTLVMNTESHVSAKTGKCKDLCKTEKEFFVENIKQVGESTHELIYAIISAYSGDVNGTSIPYDGIFVSSGSVQFNFNGLPTRLKRMLHLFLTMHLDRERAGVNM